MRHDFEERRENRLNNAQNRAKKNQQEADRLFNRASEMASVIPMGQPILVGHHSEKRDRNYRVKIDNTARKAIETFNKAGYYADKAERIAKSNAIFSDDPQAIDKLTQKLETLKKMQTFMKSANQCIKKKDEAKFLTLEFGTPDLWLKLNEPDYLISGGYASYSLTNIGANIRRIEKRLKELQAQHSHKAMDKTINGVRIFENIEANRLQLIFAEKPTDETRKRLKANAFKWSPREGAWQRHISPRALFIAEHLVNSIQFQD